MPHPDPAGDPAFGYWEVQTPSNIEFPQQSRIIEIVDNRDGTGSIYLTLLDHWSIEGDDADILANLARDIAFQDAIRIGFWPDGTLSGMGAVDDRNRILLFAIPDEIAENLFLIRTVGLFFA